MSDNGLVGKVMDVNPTSARVALLSNADNTLVRVAAMIQKRKKNQSTERSLAMTIKRIC